MTLRTLKDTCRNWEPLLGWKRTVLLEFVKGNWNVKSVTHWGIPHQFGSGCRVLQCPLVRWLFRKTMVNKHKSTDLLTCKHNNVRNALQNNTGFTGKVVFCSVEKKFENTSRHLLDLHWEKRKKAEFWERMFLLHSGNALSVILSLFSTFPAVNGI